MGLSLKQLGYLFASGIFKRSSGKTKRASGRVKSYRAPRTKQKKYTVKKSNIGKIGRRYIRGK